MNPQYKDYNYAKVTIVTNSESYVISNVNTKGMPGDNCEAHLQSLEINEPIVGSNNPDNISAGGSVTIIDYADSVFALLNRHMQRFLGKPQDAIKQELLPKIKIEIRCFTNTRKFEGRILDWNMQFSGTIPSIQLNWSIIIPSNEPIEAPTPGSYFTPKALIDDVASKYKDDRVSFVMQSDGSDAAGKIKFVNNTIDFDLTKLKTSGNKLVDTYRYIVSNSTTLDGKTITGELISEDKFAVFISDPQQNSYPTEDGNVSTNLVFIQNGKFKEYTKGDDGRYVIPMTSFSFTTKWNQLPLQSKIIGNVNGTMSVGSNGSSVNVGSTDNISTEATFAASNNTNDPITVTFECYNVMAFGLNNSAAMVKYDVYNELGKKHILSGTGMPRKCTYSLQGGVIKATVECTEVFNSLSQDVDAAVSVGETDASMSMSQNFSGYSSSSPAAAFGNDMNQKKYLCKEDAIFTSLSKDMTESLIASGAFRDEFLNAYGSTTGANRLIDVSFVNSLVGVGNYGLLTLLIAVANYGVSGAPSTWDKDAVNLDPDYKNRSAFCASNTGKGPYDYKQGGLGIAHWDSGNLKDIYSTIGFSVDTKQNVLDHFKQLLVTDNSITSFKQLQYNYNGKSINRLVPVFNKTHPDMRLFDNGLKQDSDWLNWAYSILYYRDDDDRPAYQYYLFELWVKKFWIPTVTTLKKKTPRNGHTPSLQDAVRIARAGNSKTVLIAQSCGKTVAEQYELYYADKQRYVRQKSFCRRCADIIGWENS